MGRFLYETHCHTSEVSICGKVAAKDVVENYIGAGYSGIVITDHFNRHTFHSRPEDMAEYYLSGYRAAKAGGGEPADRNIGDGADVLSKRQRLSCIRYDGRFYTVSIRI